MRLLLVFLLSLSFGCAGNIGNVKKLCTDTPSGGRELLHVVDGSPFLYEELPIVWAFDCSFPSGLRNSAREAFQYWEFKTGINLFEERGKCLDWKLDYPHEIDILVETKNEMNPRKKSIQATAKRYKIQSINVITYTVIKFWKLWLTQSVGYRRTVARHEVGHALGLEHITDWHCLMYCRVSKYAEDKEACKREIRTIKGAYGR